ncbi:MAG TPA: hypothetical protein VGD69_07675 [Herpetosiphonaceae bacterium]
MEHQVTYSELSDEARLAWETLSGLPLTTLDQQRHAWEVLRAELECLADDPQPGLHVLSYEDPTNSYELYLSSQELAALRVMIAWLKANDRAGLMRDLPIYPDVAEAIVSQLGDMPWPGVWEPTYLSDVENGGVLWLHPRTHATILVQLLDATLENADLLCPGWPQAARQRLTQLLHDVRCWLHAMMIAYDHEVPS